MVILTDADTQEELSATIGMKLIELAVYANEEVLIITEEDTQEALAA